RYEDLTLINYDNHDDMSDEENECNVDMRTADNEIYIVLD
ncbi:unnamed protein product, partial [Adineta steineri]